MSISNLFKILQIECFWGDKKETQIDFQYSFYIQNRTTHITENGKRTDF